MAAQPPAVGVTDMGDPALDAGVQLGEADFARMIGRSPRPEPAMGAAHLARLDQAMRRVDDGNRVEEDDRELPAFGIGGSLGIAGCLHHRGGGRCSAEQSNCGEELAAMPTEVTPMLIRSSEVSSGNTSPSTSLSRNRGRIVQAPARAATPLLRRGDPRLLRPASGSAEIGAVVCRGSRR
jgi:hypothetical protein